MMSGQKSEVGGQKSGSQEIQDRKSQIADSKSQIANGREKSVIRNQGAWLVGADFPGGVGIVGVEFAGEFGGFWTEIFLVNAALLVDDESHDS